MTVASLKCIPVILPSDACGVVPLIPNGNVGTCREGDKAGTTCEPKCNDGFQLDGIGICQSDGSWGKVSCKLPEIHTGAIFVRITEYETSDCTRDVVKTTELQECRCRGKICQKMGCEKSGDYTTSSFDEAECVGSPKDQTTVGFGTRGDIIKFGQCQASNGDALKSHMIQCMRMNDDGEMVPINGPDAVDLDQLSGSSRIVVAMVMHWFLLTSVVVLLVGVEGNS